MPELVFKGKEFVYNHHLSIPYHPLIAHQEKSIGTGALDGNLIIHGDNLKALKALLPHYAGKVDCIFIDPPYNTGTENWCYNDNVNSPIMREWFDTNPIGKEDLLRHDKWLCMMYPRLKLLHELLSENGSFWMTLDDNENYHARAVLNEIFGEQNFIATCIWHKVDSPKNTAQFFSEDHDYMLVYAKNAEVWKPNLLERSEKMIARYKNPDNDPRGEWLLSDLAARNFYAQGQYSITTPSGRVIDGPPAGSYWRVSEENFRRLQRENRIWWGESGDNRPGIKRFLSEVKQGVVPQTLWKWQDVGSTRNAKQALSQIFSAKPNEEIFVTPKPVDLVERVLEIATQENALVLDSFAGSGTTAHAVLNANQKDNGDRNFILIESESYADSLTAERVRKVINGYEFHGTKREELLREKLSFTSVKSPEKLLDRVAAIENLDGHRFDSFSKVVEDGYLVVTGEKAIDGNTEPIQGGFTYYTLGAPTSLDKILTGESLPSYETIGGWLFHTATGEPLATSSIRPGEWYLGESSAYYVWLIYKPDLAFLKSRDSALTLEVAEKIAASRKGKKHLVFASSKFVPNKMLLPLGVEHVTLPFGLFRIEKS